MMYIPAEMMHDVQDRIELLLAAPAVKEKMVSMKLDGKSFNEIQEWLRMCAIGTLMGIQHAKPAKEGA